MIKVLSVNVARAQPVLINGRRVITAIGKRPLSTRVPVHALGLEGDEQADLTVHGGQSKAVYAYAQEHYAFWEAARAQALGPTLAQALAPGAMGENLTLSGLLEDQLWIGDQLRLPRCVLQISEPRMPCFKFNATMGFALAAKSMMQAACCGAYLSVLEPGSVQAGESIELVPGPREVRLLDVFRAKGRGD